MVNKLFKFDNKTNYYSFIPFLVLSVIYLSYAFASIHGQPNIDNPYYYDARHQDNLPANQANLDMLLNEIPLPEP